MDPRRKSLLELNLAVLLWAGTALFAKWIALPPIVITAGRSVVAALALLAVLLWHKQTLRVQGGRGLCLLLASGLALGAHWVTYFQSIQLSTVALGILSMHTYPVMTAVAEPLFFRERLHALDLVLALVVLVGVGILVPEFSWNSPVARGVMFGLISAACFAARNILTRRLVPLYGAGRVTLYQLLATAGALVPVAMVLGPIPGPRASAQLLLLGVFFTALPHTLFTRSLAHLKARTAGIISTLLPVYGAITAALCFGEIPALRTVVGGAVILIAVVIETGRTMARPQAVADAD